MGILSEKVAERVAAAHRRLGEDVTLNPGGAARTVRAQVSIMGAAFRNARVPASEYSAWVLPALLVRIAGHDPVSVGDTFVRDSRLFAVQRVEYERIGGGIVQTVLLCA